MLVINGEDFFLLVRMITEVEGLAVPHGGMLTGHKSVPSDVLRSALSALCAFCA